MRYLVLFFMMMALQSDALYAIERIVNNATQLRTAINSAVAGDVILLNGGDYFFTSRLDIRNKNGTSTNRIIIKANPESATRPKFDFSAMAESSSNQGILVDNCSYLHFIGIDVYKAGDNGMLFKNSHHNIVEFCTFFECADSGLQIATASSNNLVLNCDSYNNADSSIENADGFACKLDVGTGNVFRGCRAWQNLDDGWDGYLRGSDNVTTTYENCWAFDNGKLKDGSIGGGDGNGFKTGGSDTKDLKHNAILINCIVAGNVNKGFDHNSNRGEITIYNGVASGNGVNIRFANTNRASKITIKNTLVYGTIENLHADVTDITHNSWNSNPPITVSAASFKSVDITELKKPRKADGSLPDVNYLRPVPRSNLIDKGINVNLPYKGIAPDIGAFEYDPSLPLTFLSFTATANTLRNSVNLNWRTANEINTKEFIVEKRTDVTEFVGIDVLSSQGTLGVHNYTYSDDNVGTGNVYYRLKQVDIDGNYAFSDVVQLNIAHAILMVYPNPAKHVVNVSHKPAKATIRVLSLDSKILLNHSVEDGITSSNLNISHLLPGTYLLVYDHSGEQSILKFVKDSF